VLMVREVATSNRVYFLSSSTDNAPSVVPLVSAVVVPAGSLQADFQIKARAPGEGHILVELESGSTFASSELKVKTGGTVTVGDPPARPVDPGGQWAQRKCVTTGGAPGDRPGHYPDDIILCCAPVQPLTASTYITPSCCPTGASIAARRDDGCSEGVGELSVRCCFSAATVAAPAYQYDGIIIIGTGSISQGSSGGGSVGGVSISTSNAVAANRGQVCCKYKKTTATVNTTYWKCSLVVWVYNCP
jgi:hypothetical protein